MAFRLVGRIVCSIVVVSALLTFAAAGQAAQSRAIKVFRPVIRTLRSSGVPLLLPSLPSLNRYHAYVELSRRGRYAVLLGYIRNCDADACEYGELTATKLPGHPAALTGARVRLAGGHTGVYDNFTCGASCGSSTVTVNVAGYVYTYGIKAAKKADVVRMTNSALRAGPAR